MNTARMTITTLRNATKAFRNSVWYLVDAPELNVISGALLDAQVELDDILEYDEIEPDCIAAIQAYKEVLHMANVAQCDAYFHMMVMGHCRLHLKQLEKLAG